MKLKFLLKILLLKNSPIVINSFIPKETTLLFNIANSTLNISILKNVYFYFIIKYNSSKNFTFIITVEWDFMERKTFGEKELLVI